VQHIAAGQNHSLALAASGRLYSWGRNDTGALGHHDSYIDIYSMEEFPRLVEFGALQAGDKVAAIAAGRGTSAALTSSGRLFMWGKAFGHQPTLVEGAAFEGLKVRKVALGGDGGRSVTAVITEDGGLWTFGDSSSKMLGLPKASGKQPTPQRVPAFIGPFVLDVFCGSGQHIAALVELNEHK
jgi:alpha-tubulin suppressor-like RCC1 family protein